ncbi:MAG: LLM class flavin-dependent oxidoreductase [Actinobacteria bacterium]|nr:LLM class flavin-dependent oxidoreductase [Actinomycetota bacterium]
MTRTAAFVQPGRSIERAAAIAATAEQLGYDTVFDNHVLSRDAFAILAHYGRTTSTVRLGTGVYPAFITTPVALGQLAASIDELLDSRLVLGLGTSHRPIIEGVHGLEFPSSPLTAMREIIEALRQLFTTGSLSYEGEYVDIGGFGFMGFEPRADLPIHLAALGPKMLQLAGELADGVILWLCDPRYVREVVVPNVRQGAERAGRDPGDIEIIPAVASCLTDEPQAAYDAQRQALLPYLNLPFYRAMLEASGYTEELAAFDERFGAGDVDGAKAAMTTAMLDNLAGIGTVDVVRGKVEEYRAAGATLPAVGPFRAEGSSEPAETLRAAIGT